MSNQLPKELRSGRQKDILKFLEKQGCEINGGGKHLKVTHPEKTGAIIVPHHKEICKGTRYSIIKAIKLWGFLLIATLILIVVFF